MDGLPFGECIPSQKSLFMPAPKHPLRLIRAATPFASVAEFANTLGVPTAVLSAVERGKVALTTRLASLVREYTGADDAALLAGRALTLAGRRYTAEAFAAWQGSPGQAAEKAKREALQRTHKEGWRAHLGGGDPESGTAEQMAVATDSLVPWQTCEFASAAVPSWRKLPDSLQRLTGWRADLPFAAKTRVTLAVQCAPAWNPSVPPPGLTAGNADLFPPCCFTMAAGSGGGRMAAAFWRAVCREHGIGEVDGIPCADGPAGNWRGFFRSDGSRCVPHAVFAGMDEEEAAPLRGRPFDGAGVICGGDEQTHTPRVMEFMQQFSVDAGSPSGILLFASLEGSTASALTCRLLAALRAEFPSVPLMVIGALPLPGKSPVATAPWHVALAMLACRLYADVTVVFSNEQLIAQARRDWQMESPGYAEANLLIAEALTSLTAPLRFGGTDMPPADMASLLACFATGGESRQLITGAVWPLAALLDRRMKVITLPWMVQALAVHALPTSGTGESVALFLKTRPVARFDWVVTDDPVVLQLTGRIRTGIHESATVFAPLPVVFRTLRRLQREALALWTEWAAGRLDADLGVEPEVLAEAIRIMAE